LSSLLPATKKGGEGGGAQSDADPKKGTQLGIKISVLEKEIFDGKKGAVRTLCISSGGGEGGGLNITHLS